MSEIGITSEPNLTNTHTHFNSDTSKKIKDNNTNINISNLSKNFHLNLSSEDTSNDLSTKKTHTHTNINTKEIIDSPNKKYADIVKEVKSNPQLYKIIKEAIIELSFETVNYNIKEDMSTIDSPSEKVVNTKKLVIDYLNSYFNDYLIEEYIIIDLYDDKDMTPHSTIEDKHIIDLAQFLNGDNSDYHSVKDDLGSDLVFNKNEVKNIMDNMKNRYLKIENIQGANVYIQKSQLEKGKNSFRRQAYQDYLGMTHYVNLYNFIAKNMIQSHPKDYSRKDLRVKSFKANVKFLQTDYNQLLQVLIVYDKVNKMHLIDLITIAKNNSKGSWLNNNYIDVHGNHFSLCSTNLTSTYCNNELNHAIQLLDDNNEHFYVKKCFLKYLTNKIIHNEPLPDNDQTLDINGNVRHYCPSVLYDILIQLTNILECFVSKENKYVMIKDRDESQRPSLIKRDYLLSLFKDKEDINSENSQPLTDRITCCVSIRIQSGAIRKVYKSELNLEYCYIKIYDLKGTAYVVTYKSFKKLLDKLIEKEPLGSNEIFDSYTGEKIALKPACIRSKISNYFPLTSPKTYYPYRILYENNKSYFKITNYSNGKSVMMQTQVLLNILKSNSLKEFIFFNEDTSIKLCIEEIKQTLKEANQNNEYLLVNNVNNGLCYIKKNIIFEQLDLLIENKGIPEVINAIDNNNQIQFIKITKTLSELIDLSPIPYVKDDILYQRLNTYTSSPQGVIALISDEQFDQRNKMNELFEFIRVIDNNKEVIYIRKPFIRNMLVSGNSIPNMIEINDSTYNCKRIVHKKDLFFIESSIKPGFSSSTMNQSSYSSASSSPNIIIKFKMNTYVEVSDCFNTKHLILKHNLDSIIKSNSDDLEIKDVKGEKFKFSKTNKLAQIDLNHEWLKISTINKKEIFVYKSVIKNFIRDHVNNISLVNNAEIYDYECKKQIINPKTIIDLLIITKCNQKNNNTIIVVNSK